jgi:hypothetical protein
MQSKKKLAPRQVALIVAGIAGYAILMGMHDEFPSVLTRMLISGLAGTFLALTFIATKSN